MNIKYSESYNQYPHIYKQDIGSVQDKQYFHNIGRRKKRTSKKKIPVSLIPRVLQPSQGCLGVSETNEDTF